MRESSINIKALLPVLFGFFIMGFCDVVGISTSYVKADFRLSENCCWIPAFNGVFVVFVIGCSGSNLHESYRSEKNGAGKYVGNYCGDDYPFY